MQERVEDELLDVDPKNIDRTLLLICHGERFLEDLKNYTTLFRNHLRSFKSRLDLVREAGGKY